MQEVSWAKVISSAIPNIPHMSVRCRMGNKRSFCNNQTILLLIIKLIILHDVGIMRGLAMICHKGALRLFEAGAPRKNQNNKGPRVTGVKLGIASNLWLQPCFCSIFVGALLT